MKGYDVEASSGKQQIKTNMDVDKLEPKGGGEMNAAGVGGAIVEEYEYKLPPPIEKTYDREHEYLLPLRHFSDVRSIPCRYGYRLILSWSKHFWESVYD
jgi:hypothetical protein